MELLAKIGYLIEMYVRSQAKEEADRKPPPLSDWFFWKPIEQAPKPPVDPDEPPPTPVLSPELTEALHHAASSVKALVEKNLAS